MSYVASELRRLRKEQVRLNRRVAMAELSGIVAERDPKTRKVRLELGEDPDTGAKVLGPWVRVQSGSAGKFKSFVLPSEGEQMTLSSASGVVGGDSVARFGTFTDTNKHPEQEADEAVLLENGKSRISIKDGRIIYKVGDSTTTITDGQVVTETGNSVTTHKNGEVETKVAGSSTKVQAARITHKTTRIALEAARTTTTGRLDAATGGVVA